MAARGDIGGWVKFLLVTSLYLWPGCGPSPTALNPENPNLPAGPSEPTPVESLTFFTFGDWGTGGTDQQAVADAVLQFCTTNPCDFGLLLGDNFYETGVASVNDPQWQTKFEQVYAGLDLPFYAVLGNHDHGQGSSGVQAQIDYTLLQDRWVMPGEQFHLKLPEGGSPPLVEIFALDSTDLDANQVNELALWLSQSQATWKLLALHHPFYSNGAHGDDSAGINAMLLPLVCNTVDLILAGHDHLFAHLENPDGGNDGCPFQQVVVGTGGKTLYAPQPHSGALFSEASFGFAAFLITKEELQFSFIRSDGSLAYTFHLTPATH